MNIATLKKILKTAVIILVPVALFWLLFVRGTFVTVSLPAGADAYQINSTYSGSKAAKGTSGLIHVNRGKYVVRYYSKDLVVGMQLWQPAILPFMGLKPINLTAVKASNTPFMGGAADYVTPLLDGSYLYENKETKAIESVDAAGIHNLSSYFNLSDSNAGVYSTVVNILPVNDGSVLVVTTRGIYSVRGQKSISRIKPYLANTQLNFYGAAYDNKTNALFLLNTYDDLAYRYQLELPEAGLVSFYKSSKRAQAISAGGGKVVFYSNNFPTTDAVALKTYGEKILMTPVLVDATSGKTSPLGTFKNPTLLLPSGSGDYLAVKEKFSTTLLVYSFQSKKTIELPSYDTSGVLWVGDKLYLARDNGVWVYDASGSDINLAKVAETGSGVTRIRALADTLTISTLGDIAQEIKLDEAVNSTTPVTALGKIRLIHKDYGITFDALGGKLHINTRSYQAAKGGGIGSEAQQAVDTIEAAFPDLNATTAINDGFVGGPYLYATGEL